MVTLIASESLLNFMQGSSASSSEEKLSLPRCRLRLGSFVPVGSYEPASRALREHSPVGMLWHNCPKKVDILSMWALSWSTAFSSLFVVPVGSIVVAPGGLSTEGALVDCSSIVLVIIQ